MERVIRSPAKINWTLRVVRRREDGYHEIESLVSAITLYDELRFSDRADSAFVLTCDDPAVPTDDRNLIRRAAAMLRAETPDAAGLDCRLTKRIPSGGGLGGGSSNAAAALVALNALWSLNWPTDRLLAAAARLGSDVPFFIRGGTAVISGRGERVRPTTLDWQGWIVLLLPALAVSTARVYGAWRPAAPPVEPPSDPEAGAPGEPPAVRWMRRTYNMLEPPAMQVCPALKALREEAARIAGRPVRMSGSGSTLFTAFDTEAQACTLADLANRKLQLRTVVVRPVEQSG